MDNITGTIGTTLPGYTMRAHVNDSEVWSRLLRTMFARDGVTVIEYHDDWRRTDRTLRYVGRCASCARRTWAADDGENDPRGVLGDNAASPLCARDCDMVGPDVPLCFLCANEYEPYQVVYDHAVRHLWRQPEAPEDGSPTN